MLSQINADMSELRAFHRCRDTFREIVAATHDHPRAAAIIQHKQALVPDFHIPAHYMSDAESYPLFYEMVKFTFEKLKQKKDNAPIWQFILPKISTGLILHWMSVGSMKDVKGILNQENAPKIDQVRALNWKRRELWGLT
ncbi:uncharacterized protein N7483_000769 [Penicillium malachiteum]|uniref:uncharacterized protein n=1 Tax=Penicillium malachiteum TaxID=1324776 RepID=UPI002548F1C9|nr:uncharacterized protein N7483_000769 [Penicillium malachiteum]KAJ5735644.1 hypothetical protein N7483_000769 [Penicillium malachiteum]